MTVYTNFDDIPRGKYGAILADPPWNFKAWSQETGIDRSAEKHYSVMSIEDIYNIPVSDFAAEDCALFLWVVDPSYDKGFVTIGEWGFTYKTRAWTWIKTNPKSGGLFTGMGYWTRANPEDVLLATIGSPKRLNADVHRVIVSPRREHSRKPDEQYERIERLVGGPYLELFARAERSGWDSFGNEVGKFNPEPKQHNLL